ncbi:MAG: hypothetical protein Q8K59_10385 [Nitrosomonas sp.]|nr:hypothetical protein [Nitrosomonas sp.]MDP1951480.1 hypothetical protein [Nitrosomonas sp.]
MAFIAESITTFYDQQEDRLSLIFNDKDKKQLKGNMTRQLFKGLLAQLPNWLAQQRTDSMPQTVEQQWEISQIHHQVSQQKVTVTYGKIQPNKRLETFLISTVSFAKGDLVEGDQKIRLDFVDLNKTIEIIFVLNSAQLHKFINEILKQVQAWDIDNPWQEKSIAFVSLDTKGRVVH